jgi:hypothetical protein
LKKGKKQIIRQNDKMLSTTRIEVRILTYRQGNLTRCTKEVMLIHSINHLFLQDSGYGAVYGTTFWGQFFKVAYLPQKSDLLPPI